jgi:hypothetical protein
MRGVQGVDNDEPSRLRHPRSPHHERSRGFGCVFSPPGARPWGDRESRVQPGAACDRCWSRLAHLVVASTGFQGSARCHEEILPADAGETAGSPATGSGLGPRGQRPTGGGDESVTRTMAFDCRRRSEFSSWNSSAAPPGGALDSVVHCPSHAALIPPLHHWSRAPHYEIFCRCDRPGRAAPFWFR